MAYLVRRFLENTSNESFLRKEYVESQPLTTLLARSTAQTTPMPASEPTGFRNEPLRDFSQPEARSAMQEAIGVVKGQLGRLWPPVAGVVTLSGPLLTSHNPSRPDEVVGVVQAPMGAMSNMRCVRQATRGRRGAIDRLRTGEGFACRGSPHAGSSGDLAAWEILECGKPWREADADIAEAIDFLEFYAAEGLRLSTPKRLGHAPGELNQRLLSPRGLTAVIAPWNFPLAIPAGMVSAALVTGNPVIFKPSERSPLIGRMLVQILIEAGVPQAVLFCLPGGPTIGQALVHHPDMVTIAFTGSKHVGLNILKDASTIATGQQMVKRVIAEMGGKNAIIVDETADLDDAVAGVVASSTSYSGQKCSACSRVIVHAAVYDIFLSRLRDAMRACGWAILKNPELRWDRSSTSGRRPKSWNTSKSAVRKRVWWLKAGWRSLVGTWRRPFSPTSNPPLASHKRKSSGRCWR